MYLGSISWTGSAPSGSRDTGWGLLVLALCNVSPCAMGGCELPRASVPAWACPVQETWGEGLFSKAEATVALLCQHGGQLSPHVAGLWLNSRARNKRL